jgi:hypothetical protein
LSDAVSEKIEKKKELRITIVGRDVYAFEIDSQQSEAAKIDWRKDGNLLINGFHGTSDRC